MQPIQHGSSRRIQVDPVPLPLHILKSGIALPLERNGAARLNPLTNSKEETFFCCFWQVFSVVLLASARSAGELEGGVVFLGQTARKERKREREKERDRRSQSVHLYVVCLGAFGGSPFFLVLEKEEKGEM